MSRNSKGNPQARNTTKASAPLHASTDPRAEDDLEEPGAPEVPEEVTSRAQRARTTQQPSARYKAPDPQTRARTGSSAPSGPQSRLASSQATAPRATPPRRGSASYTGYTRQRTRGNILPFITGALVSIGVAGLLVVAFLLGSSVKSGGVPTNGALSAGGAQSIATPLTSGGSGAPAIQEPPRLPMADFRKLYDNPATRPVVIDVRTKDLYDAQHVKGAISVPVADVASRLGAIPKDRLVVAYCQ